MLTTRLTPADLLHCTRRLPPAVISVLKEFHGRLFLAGGFIRAVISGEEVADIDLIAATPEVASEAAERLRVIQNLPSGPPDGPRRMHTSGNAYTVSGLGRVPVQIIHRWTYSQVELALAEFDFTIACAGIYWAGTSPDAGHWTSAAHDRARFARLRGRPDSAWSVQSVEGMEIEVSAPRVEDLLPKVAAYLPAASEIRSTLSRIT